MEINYHISYTYADPWGTCHTSPGNLYEMRENVKRKRTIILSVLLAFMVLLSACGPDEAPVPTEIAQAELEPTATEEPTEIPEPTATEEIRLIATSVPEEEVVEENEAAACIDCHSDKELLIETARVEEEVESENEGEG